jgi:iron complex outermembrane receptor protein
MTRITTCAAMALFAACGVGHAHSDPASPLELHIESQTFERAIATWAEQTGYQVLIPQERDAGSRVSPGVKGTYTPEGALKVLLSSTDLKYQFVNENTVAISDSSSSTERPVPTYAANDRKAADAKSRTAEVQQVVVTGSRFSDRTVLTSPVPVDVVGSSDLRAGGYSELPQALAAEVPALNFPPVQAATAVSAIRPFNYRGLPANEVLVLVEGKRWHPAAFLQTGSFDFNSIAPTAVDSVQVLRDGASAQYGSDAIAGVVNILLRKDVGTEMVATGGRYYKGDGDTAEIGLNHGRALGDEGFFHISTYYRNSQSTNRQGTDVSQQYFARNSSGAAVSTTVGNVFTRTLPAGLSFDPREFTGVDRNNTVLMGNSARREAGLSFNLELPFTASTSGYAFGDYTYRKAETPAIWRAPRDVRNVRAIFPDGFEPIFDARIADVNLAMGIKGEIGRWDWDLSESWGFNRVAQYLDNTVNTSLGTASPTHFYRGAQRTGQATTNLDLRRSFDIGLAEPLRLATGSEFRYETYETRAGEPASYINGGVPVLDGPAAGTAAAIGSQGSPGFTPTDAGKASRHSVAVYADAENQLTQKLLLTAAARFEHYNDFGSTFNGKVSLFHRLTDVIALRASASSGFRAPSLLESNYSATLSNIVLGQFVINRNFPVADPVAQVLGARALDPEKSRSYSLGTTVSASENLSFTLDAYRIFVDDSIIQSSLFSGTPIVNFLTANGFPGVTAAQFFINAVDKRVDGADLVAHYVTRFDSAGRLTLSLGVNVNDVEVRRVAATPLQLAAITTTPLFDRRSIVNVERGAPRNRVSLSTKYEFRGFQFFVRATRYGSIEELGFAPPATDQVFSAKWITDLDVSYDVTDALRLTAGGQNIFNQYPDQVIPINNPGGAFTYLFNGAPFGMSGGYYYFRAVYRF